MNKPRRIAFVIGAVVMAALLAGIVVIAAIPRPKSTDDARPTRTPSAVTPLPTPTAAAIAALPEARYDAVIEGLIPFDHQAGPGATFTTWRLHTDLPLYGRDKAAPVALLRNRNFLNEPTTVVSVETVGPWTLVLTPARRALPSATSIHAPAQTAAWVATKDLSDPKPVTTSIIVSVSAQTLTVFTPGRATTFKVGIGGPSTPTPTDVTGYLEARYLDPAQGQSRYPIQLTSLHSTSADEPYGGHDGGLIGAHYQPVNTGAVSHGCIRLSAEAISALNELPLGTPITLQL